MRPNEILVMRPGQAAERIVLPPKEACSFLEMKPRLLALIGAEYVERVAVLHGGQRRDMFVDEDGIARGLPVNPEATAIYRAASLAREPATDPESLPAIHGPAVLCGQLVWR